MDLARTGRVEAFLREHLLHWLEALGLMQAASERVLVITMLQFLVRVSELANVWMESSTSIASPTVILSCML